ncbi:MAG: orotidine-5'-phosphate decarboxylase, partial [Candidatus Omnitrophica bacterium]|nr:orotidine-5'-phosphate decarboxylase [Candidatus Omnitrophota bacterium]
DRLIIALDVDTKEEALKLIDTLSPEIDVFKVGIAPFTAFGQILLDKLDSLGKKVFLDLKFHDIPNTVKNAAYAAAQKNVFMMNFHCLGGEKMMKAAVEGAAKAGSEKKPLLLGVTMLTSMDEKEMKELGMTGTIFDKVTALALLAKKAGLDGVVASAKEAGEIKKKAGKDFLVVTPGIRPAWASQDDQKRILTPREAVSAGADYIVVGRPVIAAADPLEAAGKILKEIG